MRKKKHPEPPLSHILAYPMVANMAGSGVQERVRVSAVRVRGKRRACAITGGLPCRRTRRSSMSEYRPGVTSPHTLPQRAHPLSPRSSFGLIPLRPLPTRPSLSYYLAEEPPTWRFSSSLPLFLALCIPTRFLSVAPAASFHLVLFSHYPGPSCLRHSSDPLSSLLSSHRSPLEDGAS